MWFLLMLVILLTNGMSSFGLKMIAAWGLPPAIKYPYLTVWYAGGLAAIALPTFLKGLRVGSMEILWGGLAGVLSVVGQVAMAIALGSGVPGHVVFPTAIGGSIFVVALAGRLVFGERMNPPTALGVALGFSAVILLGVS
ncbi:MAG TPA: hypothetical protein VMO17_00445 [Terriglobia bacterium]|nr:hypothetical protein [Terriglobia bacterium]